RPLASLAAILWRCEAQPGIDRIGTARAAVVRHARDRPPHGGSLGKPPQMEPPISRISIGTRRIPSASTVNYNPIVSSKPYMTFMFCTAAPEAPLIKLSRQLI